jgi:hypothetical protein
MPLMKMACSSLFVSKKMQKESKSQWRTLFQLLARNQTRRLLEGYQLWLYVAWSPVCNPQPTQILPKRGWKQPVKPYQASTHQHPDLQLIGF